jgi:ankyrin repeat protein
MRIAPARIARCVSSVTISVALVAACAARPPLHSAARQGESAQLEALLEAGADPNAIDNNGRTPLHHAARRGQQASVEALLARGARPDVRDENGTTALHTAARRGHEDIAKRLLEAGADPDLADKDRKTPLMLAARQGHEDIVKALLESGADTEKRDESRDTALNMAAGRRHNEVVKLLLEGGAPTNVPDRNGRTPLYNAVDRRDRETVEVLLESRADPNLATHDGDSPLLRAIRNRDAEIVTLLLEYGAQPSTTRRGDTSAVVLSVRNRDHDTLGRLIEAQADVNERAENGNSALAIAIVNRDLRSAEMLLEAGAIIDVLNHQNGETLLYTAVRNHDYEAATLLIEHGADPDAKTPSGARPLALAISNRDRAMTALLLEAGAEPTTIGELLADPNDFIAKYGYRKLITATITQARQAAGGVDIDIDPVGEPELPDTTKPAPGREPRTRPAPMQTREPATPEQKLAALAPPPRAALEKSSYYSRRVAVVVGIDRYTDWPPLEGAQHDAQQVSAAFREMGFDEVIEIYDADATRTRILNALGSDLAKLTDPDSMAVIYFAGHGQTESLANGAKRGYIVPVDAHPNQVFATAISMDTLRSISSRLPAKQVYYAMDSCYSGLGFTRGIALKADPGEDYIRKVTSQRAVQMITAGADGEQALERGGQGIFTRYFLRALSGEADYDGDGWVTASEIGTYVRPHVTAASSSRQTPRFGTLEGSGEVAFRSRLP